MIRHSTFRFSGYQGAAFYANLQLTVGKVLPRLLSELSDVLDGDPITIPVPAEGPAEVPRIILGNKEQSMRMEISLARTDIRWQLKPTVPELNFDQFSSFAQRAFACFHQITQANPGRVALVLNRFQLHENPGKEIASHFCRPELLLDEPGRKGPLNRPEHFELHAHKRFDLGRFRVNSWVRCKTGTFTEGESRQKIIFVEQDINTLPERLAETEFNEADIREFYELSIAEFDTIMRLYFPDA